MFEQAAGFFKWQLQPNVGGFQINVQDEFVRRAIGCLNLYGFSKYEHMSCETIIWNQMHIATGVFATDLWLISVPSMGDRP